MVFAAFQLSLVLYQSDRAYADDGETISNTPSAAVGPAPKRPGKSKQNAPKIKSNLENVRALGGQLSCSAERKLRSMVADQSIYVTFINNTGIPINTNWLNYQGARVFYNTIGPGESLQQQTFLTHPWVLVDGVGRCLKLILPGVQEQVISVP
jgi:hypothetical protein